MKERNEYIIQTAYVILCLVCHVCTSNTDARYRNLIKQECKNASTLTFEEVQCVTGPEGGETIRMKEKRWRVEDNCTCPKQSDTNDFGFFLEMENRLMKNIEAQLQNMSLVMQEQRELIQQLLTEKQEVVEKNSDPSIDSDCSDIMTLNHSVGSGVYNITMNGGRRQFQVYCDMDHNGGGWTVIQRRIDGSEGFHRPWADYAKGFGSPAKEFWLGNDHLSSLTAARQYRLRIDLGDWEGKYKYAEYSLFRVSDWRDKYRLSELGTYTGDAGNAMVKHLGQQFSTYDQDNDSWGRNCAEEFLGAWWYNACHDSNLNGEYNNTYWAQGVNWRQWRNHMYSLRFTEMKIRPVTF